MTEPELQQSSFPSIRRVTIGAPLRWLAAGASDLRAHPLPSAFYGACFALMGWLIAWVFRHSVEYLLALVSGFFLLGPFLAVGLYDLSRRQARGERVSLGPTLAAWRGNAGAIGVFVLVVTVVLLVWARASLILFALFYSSAMPTVATFFAQMFALDNAKFLLVYACVGGLFALLTFAISVVSVPMMLDRDTDGIVAPLTSLRAFAANPAALLLWALLIVAIVGAGFVLAFAGLIIAAPLIGHATWFAYRDLVADAA